MSEQRLPIISRLNSEGPAVARLQERLLELGMYDGPVSGIYDDATRNAVQFFQRKAALIVDGIVGDSTWARLKIDPERLRDYPPVQGKTEQQPVDFRQEVIREPFTKAAPSNIPPVEENAVPTTSSRPIVTELPDEFRKYLQYPGLTFQAREPRSLPSSLSGIYDTGWDLVLDFRRAGPQRQQLNPPAESADEPDIFEDVMQYAPTDFDVSSAAFVPAQIWLTLGIGSDIESLQAPFNQWAKDESRWRGMVFQTPDRSPATYLFLAGFGKTLRLEGFREISRLPERLAERWPEQIFRSSTTTQESASAESIATSFDRPIAGFTADDLERDDRLGFENEVKALCSVIAARDVAPPLSIGLFGDWGVGKSFFMKEMSKRIRVLCGKAAEVEALRGQPGYDTEPAYWSNIAQIQFNAWHYVDANLWASLAARIFDGLAQHIALDKGTSVEDQRSELYRELELAHEAVQELEQDKEQVETRRREEEGNLQKIRSDLAAAERALAEDLDLERAAGVVWQEFCQDNPELQKVLDTLGLEAMQSSMTMMKTQMRELNTTWGKTRMRLAALFSGEHLRSRLATLAAIILGGVALRFLIAQWQAGAPLMMELIAELAQLITWIGGIATSISGWLGKTNGAMQQLNRIYDRYQAAEPAHLARLKAARAQQEARIAQLRAEETAAVEKLSAARERIAFIEQKIADLKVGRRLFQFIEARVSSSDYTGKLGIIALIRNDLDKLSDLLFENSRAKRQAWKLLSTADTPATAPEGETAETEDTPPAISAAGPVAEIDRIILYIDDLDRCPPERVVEVLQAVHLLLAFKLFVVVVAVDSRWLLRSLEKSYPDFLILDQQVSAANGITARLASTPQNYLEKIFQIAFAIKPMDPAGFNALVDEFTAGDAAKAAADTGGSRFAGDQQDAGPSGQNADDSRDEQRDGSDIERTRQIAEGADQETATTGEGADLDADSVNPPHLILDPHEIAFMKRLHGILRTPRVVNRFVNTYRLVRASVGERELALFQNPDGHEHRIVLLLLALLTGFPREAVDIFRGLDQADPESDWQSFAARLLPRQKPDQAQEKKADAQAKKSPKKNPAPEAAEAAPPHYENGVARNIPAGDIPRWQQIHRSASAVSELNEERLDHFKTWMRRVARYGFYPVRFEGVDQ